MNPNVNKLIIAAMVSGLVAGTVALADQKGSDSQGQGVGADKNGSREQDKNADDPAAPAAKIQAKKKGGKNGCKGKDGCGEKDEKSE